MGDTTYAEARAALDDALHRLATLAERRSSTEVAAGARHLAGKLAEERFTVVVAGEFKRGKTTFVNALLGAEVLPSAVVPLTSVVTAVTWGAEARAEVVFRDGRAEAVDASELARYVTERENPAADTGGVHQEHAVAVVPAQYRRGLRVHARGRCRDLPDLGRPAHLRRRAEPTTSRP